MLELKIPKHPKITIELDRRNGDFFVYGIDREKKTKIKIMHKMGDFLNKISDLSNKTPAAKRTIAKK